MTAYRCPLTVEIGKPCLLPVILGGRGGRKGVGFVSPYQRHAWRDSCSRGEIP